MASLATLPRIRMRTQKVSGEHVEHPSTNIFLVGADFNEGLVVNMTPHKHIVELLAESGERGMTINVSSSSLVRVITLIRSTGPLQCTRQF